MQTTKKVGETSTVVGGYFGTIDQFGSRVEIRNGQYNCTNRARGQLFTTDGVFDEEGFLLKLTFMDEACNVPGKMRGLRQ